MLLRRDNIGDDVIRLHSLLSRQYQISEGSVFTYVTQAAVMDFQRKNSLEVDGIVGYKTISVLEACKETPTKVFPIKRVIELPYFSQRDNVNKPNATCNITSLAMVLSYYGLRSVDGRQLEDVLYNAITSEKAVAYFRKTFPHMQNYNTYNLHEMLVWTAKQYGYSGRVLYSAKDADVVKTVLGGTPVIFSGRFTGSGHIVVMVGITCGGDYIIHDPYGDWMSGYKSANGAFVVYPWNKLDYVWKDKPDTRNATIIERN